MPKIILKSGNSNFELEIGTEKMEPGAHFSFHAGKNDYKEVKASFEGNPGWQIVSATPMQESQWGSTGYSTQLSGVNAHVEEIEKITKELSSSAENVDKNKSEKINFLIKQVLDYYMKYQSANSRFEVKAWGQSHEIKVLGVVVDTKTASLRMHFNFKLVKLIAPHEFSAMKTFIENAANSQEPLDLQFA
ncbi:hypothetical protein O4G76_03990 [Limimaricola sp. G21655-S1]|uniref:hypothetical protein n=1 Tax=Limimaricola sp. G21655-S1 TaxID=3014768 RepID=UPI0022AFB8F0|nr:hypothetical protein [Limimaricola sp. G21655-S1]MCZ4260000.1 hypothetical protein [Limimaricola sp. G21655-S1]